MLNGFASSFTQRPAKSTDGPSEIAPRGNGYGESFSQPASADGLDVSLNEGSYYSGVLFPALALLRRRKRPTPTLPRS